MVTVARRALEVGDVDVILPYVHADGEGEVRDAFDRVRKVRALSPEAQELADTWFFETVVRVHRAGEGAAFTGLKPAGLDVGPVIPAAERALETGSADGLVEVLCGVAGREVERRHAQALELRHHADDGVAAARDYVEAALGLQVWAHGVYKQLLADPHVHGGAHQHG